MLSCFKQINIAVLICMAVMSCKSKSSFENPFIADLNDTQEEVLAKFEQIKNSEGQDKIGLYCSTSNGYRLTLSDDEIGFYDGIPYDSLFQSKTWVIYQIYDFSSYYSIIIEFDDSNKVQSIISNFKQEKNSPIYSGYHNIYKTEITHSKSYGVYTDDCGNYIFERINHGLTNNIYTLTKVDKENGLKYAEQIDDGELGFEHVGIDDAGADLLGLFLDAI